MNIHLAPLAVVVALLPSIATARSDFRARDDLAFVADSSSFTANFFWADAIIWTTSSKYFDLDGEFNWRLVDTTTGGTFAMSNDVPDSISGDYPNVTRGSFSQTFSSLTVGHSYNIIFRGEWTLVDGWKATMREPSVSLAAAVPEPETYAMMLAGLGLVGFMSRRRRIQR